MSVGVDLVKGVAFTTRNGDKAVSGDVSRASVCAVQATNTAKNYAKTSFVGAKAAGNFINFIDETAKGTGFSSKVAKGFKWGLNNVNPLIGACVGVNILTSDDKEKAAYEGIPGFFGMLGSEKAFKALAKSNNGKTVLEAVENWGAKVAKSGKAGKVLAALTEGLCFVGASIGGYTGAASIGGAILENERSQKAFYKSGRMNMIT